MPIDRAGRFSWPKPSNYWKINDSVRQLNREKSQEFLAAGSNALYGLRTALATRSPVPAASRQPRRSSASGR